jgi:predicted transcriptional regulator
MTTPDRHPTTNGLALLLSPRQADIMAILWSYGPATAREIHTQLAEDTDLAYTTVTTICTRLVTVGLLRRDVEAQEGRSRHTAPYRYTPTVGETEFVRMVIGKQLDRLLAHYPALVRDHVARSEQLELHAEEVPPHSLDCTSTLRLNETKPLLRHGTSVSERKPQPERRTANRKPTSELGLSQVRDRTDVVRLLRYLRSLQTEDGDCIDEPVLDTIAMLLDRAQAAEHRAVVQEIEAQHAHRQAQEATQRAEAAEAQIASWKAETHRAQQQVLLAEAELAAQQHRTQMQQYAKTVVEHYDPAGICRVCGQKAAPGVKRRRDGLRVCDGSNCKREAQRRDNVIKQRLFHARRRQQHVELAMRA